MEVYIVHPATESVVVALICQATTTVTIPAPNTASSIRSLPTDKAGKPTRTWSEAPTPHREGGATPYPRKASTHMRFV